MLVGGKHHWEHVDFNSLNKRSLIIISIFERIKKRMWVHQKRPVPRNAGCFWIMIVTALEEDGPWWSIGRKVHLRIIQKLYIYRNYTLAYYIDYILYRKVHLGFEGWTKITSSEINFLSQSLRRKVLWLRWNNDRIPGTPARGRTSRGPLVWKTHRDGQWARRTRSIHSQPIPTLTQRFFTFRGTDIGKARFWRFFFFKFFCFQRGGQHDREHSWRVLRSLIDSQNFYRWVKMPVGTKDQYEASWTKRSTIMSDLWS